MKILAKTLEVTGDLLLVYKSKHHYILVGDFLFVYNIDDYKNETIKTKIPMLPGFTKLMEEVISLYPDRNAMKSYYYESNMKEKIRQHIRKFVP